MKRRQMLGRLGLLNETCDYKEITTNPERQRAKGFCTYERCEKRYDVDYLVPNNSSVRYRSNDQSVEVCPLCGYALYWTRNWKSPDDFKKGKDYYPEKTRGN